MLRTLSFTYLGLVLVAVCLISKKEEVRGASMREPLIYNSHDITLSALNANTTIGRKYYDERTLAFY